MTPPFALAGALLGLIELVPLLLSAYLYARRSATLARKGRPVPLWRQLCFAGGLLVIFGAIASPIDYIAEELVIAHMVEHLLIGDIASLLLVLGLTGPLLQPILSIKIFDKLRVLANPLVAFPLWAANLFFWHIPVMYDAAYGGAFLHAVEHSLFIFFGCLMWMPVFGPLPKPTWFTGAWNVVYVIAVRFTGAILGNVLMWSGTVLYDRYTAGELEWGLTPLQDQSTAGVIMMIEGTFLALALLAYAFFQAAREGMEKQKLLDLAFDRGIELTPERAQRAVASGHGARLEKELRASGHDPGEVPRTTTEREMNEAETV